jgi:TPR repeat protein
LDYALGVPDNLFEAARYCLLSANQGKSEGEGRYRLCLENGDGIDSPNPLTAAEYYKPSADQGNPSGQWHSGYRFEHGIRIAHNISGAAGLYKLSAEQGNSDGQWHYGCCLKGGTGLVQNVSEAAKQYKLSADQDNSNGQLHYGQCLEHGVGVARDLTESADYMYYISCQPTKGIPMDSSITASVLNRGLA